MTLKIKICGITNLEDALAACDAGADALGFVVAPEAKKRKRYIDPAEAKKIIASVPPFILTVGVVVNESLDSLKKLAEIFDRLQLHGEEDEETCRMLGRRAFKAFRLSPDFDADRLRSWPGDLCLLDSWAPDSRGGTGITGDWTSARNIASFKKVILAGGLTPENVGTAIRTVQPYAVDASGSLEGAPGKKDHERIRKFISEARAAAHA
ncbi:MAG: phosphoribosylanthranilate isomerase [Candidatus Hydrogenedens sp.]|jgi:phosphoribosylanthranilate isomerase|nr:phosphoribosylanthranilate isomerase [Candidatus Hydrogenedens sp.]